MSPLARRSCPVAALLAAACGLRGAPPPDIFASPWHGEAGSTAAVLREVRSASVPNVPALALGVASGRLWAEGLGNASVAWSHPIATEGAPMVAGTVVVVASRGVLFGFDGTTGRSLWSVAAPHALLRSVSDDGTSTLASIELAASGDRQLLAISRNGTVALRLETPRTTGSVQAVAGFAFVPWGGTTVSAVVVPSGREQLRLAFRFGVYQALRLGRELYFGGDDRWVRFDERVQTSSPTLVELPRDHLPDGPVLRAGGAARASDEVMSPTVYALPNMSGGRLGVDHGRFVGVWGPLVVGIDAARAEARWVRTLEAAPLAVAAARGGCAICSATGHVVWIDEDGGLSDRSVFRGPLGKCTLQVGELRAPRGVPPPPLLEQLTTAVATHAQDLTNVRGWLTARLGSLPQPEATRALIDIASHPTTPPAVAAQAKQSLARRTNGVEYMLQALARHYDFLGQTTLSPPPVGALADALARLHETRAAPLLAEQLNDPANSASDVEHAARALESLATPEQTEALSTFLSLYRATADQPELVAAVVSVARALIRVGGAQGADQVKQAANDPLTLPEIQRQLRGLEPDQPRDAGS